MTGRTKPLTTGPRAGLPRKSKWTRAQKVRNRALQYLAPKYHAKPVKPTYAPSFSELTSSTTTGHRMGSLPKRKKSMGDFEFAVILIAIIILFAAVGAWLVG